MTYTHQGWTLHCREVKFKVGKKIGPARTIYFFSKRKPNSGTPCDMPNGYTIVYNKKTGMPLLKKICKLRD